MFRRLLRFFSVVGLVVMVVMAVLGQFSCFGLDAQPAFIRVDFGGVLFEYPGSYHWHVFFPFFQPAWTVKDYLFLPGFHFGHDYARVVLPWWLLLSVWGLLTTVIWRLTRLRRIRQGFPIE
jgi:hypothetical protein